MNILVTGANGQLGNCVRNASVKGSDKYFFTDIPELDITDRGAVKSFLRENDIDIIINCAAYTNVDKAEDEYDKAELLNADGPYILSTELRERNGTLFHISTDYVFGGSQLNIPATEEVATNPTGVYGLTKLHGEDKIRESGVKSLIFRTAWLYSEYGNNFVKTILKLTSEKPALKVVFDQVGTPTYAQDLADVIVGIISGRNYDGNEGIYHYSNEGVCSWYDFSCSISEEAGNRGCRISPCHSDEFPSKVVRPSYSVLDKTKVKNTFSIEIPHWRESLKKCISRLEKVEF